jgi:hypothetical protein
MVPLRYLVFESFGRSMREEYLLYERIRRLVTLKVDERKRRCPGRCRVRRFLPLEPFDKRGPWTTPDTAGA